MRTERSRGWRSICAAGNSGGDFRMLEWTISGDCLRFGLVVQHADAELEFAYDCDSRCGKLDKALNAAPDRG